MSVCPSDFCHPVSVTTFLQYTVMECWSVVEIKKKKKAECKSVCGQTKGPVTQEKGRGCIWSKNLGQNVYNVKLHPIIGKVCVPAEFGLFL